MIVLNNNLRRKNLRRLEANLSKTYDYKKKMVMFELRPNNKDKRLCPLLKIALRAFQSLVFPGVAGKIEIWPD